MTMWDALVHLQPLFKGGSSTGSWRASQLFFKLNAECAGTKPGIVTMSPAWFEQAQDVSQASLSLFSINQLMLICLTGTQF